jgi:hypothetical protein
MSFPHGMSSDGKKTDHRLSMTRVDDDRGVLEAILTDGTMTTQKLAIGADGAASVKLTGSTLDLRGLFANRPSASEVPAGTTYWAIDKDDDDELTASDGTNWVVK